MTHVYKVEINEAHRVYVEAETKAEAKRVALDNVTAERLGVSEVIALTRRGVAIVSAASGQVCNGPTDDQADLPLPATPPHAGVDDPRLSSI